MDTVTTITPTQTTTDQPTDDYPGKKKLLMKQKLYYLFTNLHDPNTDPLTLTSRNTRRQVSRTAPNSGKFDFGKLSLLQATESVNN